MEDILSLFCAYFIFKKYLVKNPSAFFNFYKLFIDLLTIQVILSVVKVFTMGLQESVVGSLSFIGGGLATPLPVFGFILIWMNRQGAISRRDWIYIAFLLFIGFASYKRAIWFLYFVPRRISFSKLFYYTPLIPLIFYAGIRLNPSLNKEGRIGGSFDFNFAMDYINTYTFGKTVENNLVQIGQGRGGATLLLWDKLVGGKSLTFNDYWGSGLEKIYTVDYEKFDENNFGISNKGAASGVFQSFIVSGYIGILVTLFFMISVLRLVREPRIRISLGFLMLWDYFFYSGLIIRTQALFIMFFYIILFTNIWVENRKPDTNLQLYPG
jgi:F0F1-type ATP synthase assembly protein I